MTRRAAIYLRISDDREGRELGVTRQEEDCRAFAKEKNLAVVSVYSENDTGASIRSKKPRPKYADMLRAVAAREVDVVIAYSNSRLTRRPSEYEELIRLHEATGVRYLTVVSGEDNLATADGRMIARIKASIDAAEAERISERVTRAAEQRAYLGQANGGTRPYGWSATDRTKLDPKEHAEILSLARRALAGETLRSLAADLNLRQVPTVTGAKWSPTAVRGILTNPRLVGIRVHKGKPMDKPGHWEHALDEDTYHDLRRLLLDESRRIAMTNVRKNLLTGLALCGECGGRLAAKVQMKKGLPPRPRYYCEGCNLYRTMEPIDRYVQEVIINVLEQGLTPQSPAPAGSTAKVDRIRERIAEHERLHAEEDALTPSQFLSIMATLNRRLAEAEAELARDSRPLLAVNVMGTEARTAWAELDLTTKRLVITELAEVRIHRAIRGKRGFDPATVEISPRV